MHELGITQGIIDHAHEAAARAGVSKVTDLYILMTAAADFTEESIRMYFEMLADEDESLSEAKLHFSSEPVAATCLACSQKFNTETPAPACPACGSQQVLFDPEAVMIRLTDIGVEDDEPEEAERD